LRPPQQSSSKTFQNLRPQRKHLMLAR
jgi:hypothetical protein